MYRLLFISKFTQESMKVKNALSLYPQYEIDWVRTPQHAIQSLTERQPDMAIINVETFNQQKHTLVMQLRSMGYTFPVLFLAPSGAQFFQRVAPRMGHVGYLESPCNEFELLGVIDKMRNGKKVGHRSAKRFKTNQNTNIEYWHTGRKVAGQIVNLSLGGAQLQVKEPNMRTGDILKLNVELKDLDKVHEVNAKVVWDSYDPVTQSNYLGIQFVRTVDIYQSLLNRI